MVLLIPDFEKSEEFGTKLLISTHGILFLLSHLQFSNFSAYKFDISIKKIII